MEWIATTTITSYYWTWVFLDQQLNEVAIICIEAIRIMKRFWSKLILMWWIIFILTTWQHFTIKFSTNCCAAYIMKYSILVVQFLDRYLIIHGFFNQIAGLFLRNCQYWWVVKEATDWILISVDFLLHHKSIPNHRADLYLRWGTRKARGISLLQ